MDKENKRHLKEISKLLQNKEYETAQTICNNVLESDPDNYMALVYLGACLDRMDQKDEAKLKYIKATQIQPDQLLAWQGLGKLFESCDDDFPEESMDVYLKLVNIYKSQNLYSKYLDTLNNLLKLYLKFGHSKISPQCIKDLLLTCLYDEKPSIYAIQVAVYFYAEEFIQFGTLESSGIDALSKCVSLLSTCVEDLHSDIELICNLVLQLNNKEYISAETSLSEHEDVCSNIHVLCLSVILLVKTFQISSAVELSVKALSYCQNNHRDRGFFYHDSTNMNESVKRLYWECTLLAQDRRNLKLLLEDDDSHSILSHFCVVKDDEQAVALFEKILLTKLGDRDSTTPMLDDLNRCSKLIDKISFLTTLEQNLVCRINLELALLYNSELENIIDKYLSLLEHENSRLYFANYLHIGWLYLRLNKIEESVKMLSEAYKHYPESVDVCEHFGLALLKSGGVEQGIQILESIESSFRSTEIWMCLGLQYLSKNQFNDALQAMQRVVISDKTNPLNWECLGDVVMKQGSYLRAIKAFSEAAALDPTAINPRVQCGKANLLLEKFDDALIWYKKALEIDESSLTALKGCAETHITKARLLLKQSLVKMAEVQLNQAFQYLAKAYSSVKNGQVVCLLHLIGDALTIPHSIQDNSFKINLPRHMTDLKPDDSNDFDFNQILSIDDMLKLGARYYALCLRINPNLSSNLWFCLGQNYLYQWKRSFYLIQKSNDSETADKLMSLLDSAEAFIRKAIVMDETIADYWNSLGVVLGYKHYLKGNSFFEAQHCFCKCLEIYEHPEASSNLGFLYLKEEKFDLAEEIFRHAQASNPDNTHCLLGLNSLPRGLSKDEKFSLMLQAASFEPDVNVLFQLTRYILEILSRQSHEAELDEEILRYCLLVASDGLQKILDLYPEDYRLWHDFGLLMLHTKCYRRSIKAFNKCFSLSPPTHHLSIIKYSYTLAKILGRMDDVPSVDLDEPKSFSQFCLKAYVDSITKSEEAGNLLYQKAVELSNGDGCGDDTNPECNIKHLSAVIGCHAVLHWNNPELARQAFLSALDQSEEESVGIPDCVLQCVSAYSVKTNDEEIGQVMLQLEQQQGNNVASDWVNLFAALKTLLDGPSSGLHYLRDQCHRFPDDPATWFYLAVYIWRLHKHEKMLSVLYALKNSMALSPHIPMSPIHAKFLHEVLQDDLSHTRTHGMNFLKRATLYYPQMFQKLLNSAILNT